MYIPPSRTVYFLDMLDNRYREEQKTQPASTLDGIVSDALGCTYKGQQTGDMIPNDTSLEIKMSNDYDLAEWLEGNAGTDTYYSKYENKTYYLNFEAWVAARSEFKYDFEHYRAAPGWQYALAWCIQNNLLPRGEYVVRVSW